MIIGLLLLTLLGIPQGGTVSGRVLDREGKPLANAHVIYTNIGVLTQNGEPQAIGSTPGISDTGTGRTYKTKTNKKGEFVIAGMTPGAYRVEITDAA